MPRPAADHPTPQPRNMVQQKEKAVANSPLPSWWETPSKGKASQHMNLSNMVSGSERVSSCRPERILRLLGLLSQDQLCDLCFIT